MNTQIFRCHASGVTRLPLPQMARSTICTHRTYWRNIISVTVVGAALPIITWRILTSRYSHISFRAEPGRRFTLSKAYFGTPPKFSPQLCMLIQGQSAPVFALSHLLGIKLLPRIRNWKDLVFYRPDKEVNYQHLASLLTEVVDWKLIETHWRDLMQVTLSIRAGKISSVTLLRKLGPESHKNRLYQAFRELGRVVRTIFLLQYLADRELRQQITEMTNKVESYNGFAQWIFFGGEGILAENDPEEEEKLIKYNDLVANALIFQNVVDVSRILHELMAEGYPVKREDVAALSPYLTRHIKRFGDYFIDLSVLPQPLSDIKFELPL